MQRNSYFNNPLIEYYSDDNRLEQCYLVNDIGVDIDSLLHFDKHIDHIVAKAHFRIPLFRQAYYIYHTTFRICIKCIVSLFNYTH